MKTKENALAIYMASDEVLNSITSKNLDFKDLIEEKINFLQNNSWKEIYIKWYDEENVFISQYENSKKYDFPLFILEDNEETQEKEEKTEIKEENKDFTKDRVRLSWVWFIILIFCFWIYNWFLEKNKTEAVEVKSEFVILTEKANINRLEIAKKLEFQKELRSQINKSVEEVKQIEKENNEIRSKLILLANP